MKLKLVSTFDKTAIKPRAAVIKVIIKAFNDSNFIRYVEKSQLKLDDSEIQEINNIVTETPLDIIKHFIKLSKTFSRLGLYGKYMAAYLDNRFQKDAPLFEQVDKKYQMNSESWNSLPVSIRSLISSILNLFSSLGDNLVYATFVIALFWIMTNKVFTGGNPEPYMMIVSMSIILAFMIHLKGGIEIISQ